MSAQPTLVAHVLGLAPNRRHISLSIGAVHPLNNNVDEWVGEDT